MFDGCRQRDARVHGHIPNLAAKAKTVDQVDGNRHGVRVDSYDFVVNFGIINVAIGKVDLFGVDIERNHGCVVNHITGVEQLNIGAIVGIPNRPGVKDVGGNSAPAGPGTTLRFGEKSTVPALKTMLPFSSRFPVRAAFAAN